MHRSGDSDAAFTVSAAAALAGMHAQTLRQYDRLGLVTPSRTKGRGRRYSAADVSRLREIQQLTQVQGINLAGVARILELEEQLRFKEEENERLAAMLREQAGPTVRVFAADSLGRVRVRAPGAPRTRDLSRPVKRVGTVTPRALYGWQRLAALHVARMCRSTRGT